MKLSEFFYSIQGEGRYAGAPAYFIRLAGCNFMCNWLKADGTREFCDTLEVWKNTKEQLSPQEILDRLLTMQEDTTGIPHVVITGGEPMLQREEVYELVLLLHEYGFFVELETNGSVFDISTLKLFDSINWSPKTKSAGYGIDYYRNIKALEFWKENFSLLNADMKMVIAADEDLNELKAWMKELNADADRVFLMPVSNTRKEHEDNSLKVVELCKQLGVRYSPRLHLMLWNKVVGV